MGMQGIPGMPGFTSLQHNQSYAVLAAAQNQAAAAAATAAALGGYGKIMQVNNKKSNLKTFIKLKHI